MYFCSRSGEKPIHHVEPQLSGRLFSLLIQMLFLKFPILSKTWIRALCRSQTSSRLSLPMTGWSIPLTFQLNRFHAFLGPDAEAINFIELDLLLHRTDADSTP